MKRKQKTDKAIELMKKRYPTCILCSYKSEGAHILPRNNPAKNYDSSRIDALIPLCRDHHKKYDSNKTHVKRKEWLLSHGLIDYVDRLEFFIGYKL